MKVSLAFPSLPARRVALVLSLCSLVFSVQGQTCYYPNGNASTSTDFPCSLEADSPCCPQGWQCLSNGLCYLENENYLGRYTCTDQTWQSSACPQICTYDNTAAGDEAILECSPGEYCCDTNRPDADNPPKKGCCDTGAQRFSLPSGIPIPRSQSYLFSIVSAPGPTSSAQSSSTQSHTTTTTTTTTPSSTSTSTSSTSLSSSTTQVPNPSSPFSTSQITEAPLTALPVGTATPSPSVSASNSSSQAAIIAPAVVVPVVAIAIAGLAFFLWRRNRSRKRNQFKALDPTLEHAEFSPNRASWGAGSNTNYPYDPSTAYTKQGEAGFNSPRQNEPVEIDGREIPCELPGSSPIEHHELPAHAER
ncbi:hypothetical protein VTN96DRAFT_4749 [Rasamsonia emersonii]